MIALLLLFLDTTTAIPVFPEIRKDCLDEYPHSPSHSRPHNGRNGPSLNLPSSIVESKDVKDDAHEEGRVGSHHGGLFKEER